jgi:hypothetical protein
MAEFTFSCPGCGNGILCDLQWSGHQIACPSCQTPVLVPAGPPAATPAPAAQANAAAAAARARLAARSGTGKKSTGKIITYCLIGLVAAGAFVYMMKRSAVADSKFAEKTTAVAKESGGGDLGHIGELYSVLDATDPDKMRHPKLSKAEEADLKARQAQYKERAEAIQADHDKKAAEDARLATATWTMDIESAEIPNGRANGMLSGTNFVVNTARIDRAGYAQVLALRQGEGTAANAEIFVYLSISPSEVITNRTWTITKEMKGKGVPQIIKRWKTNPRYALSQKSFMTGYAMKLEIGSPTNGTIPGKIILSLPDTEKSYVAGDFKAESSLYQTAASAYRSNAGLMDARYRTP